MIEQRINGGRRKQDRELAAHFEMMKLMAEQNNENIFEYDRETDIGRVFRVNNGEFENTAVFENYAEEMDKYTKSFDKESRINFKRAFEKALSEPCSVTVEIKLPNGEWHRAFLASAADMDGYVTTIAGRFISIHEEKTAAENIRHRAEIDSLTGVYNHVTFESFCAEKLDHIHSEAAFIMIDVDDFKIINDTLGHNVGDLVLAQTGVVINRMAGDRGYAGRLGGDEFALLLWGFRDTKEAAETCLQLREELKTIIFDMEYSASIGATFKKGRNLTFKDFYFEADQAMYNAKKNGKNQVRFFDEVDMENEQETAEKKEIDLTDVMVKKNLDFDHFAMDERLEYMFVLDAETQKCVYANKTVNDKLQIGLDRIYELTLDDFGIVKNVQEHYYTFFAGEHEDSALVKLFGQTDFFVHTMMQQRGNNLSWVVVLINLNDVGHINSVMMRRNSVQKTIQRCLDFTAEYMEGTDYAKTIEMLWDFYDADCACLVYRNDNTYNKVKDIHKESFESMAKVIRESAEAGLLDKFEELWDSTNHALIGNIKDIREDSPVLYNKLADCRIWSILAYKLERNGENVGAVIVLNPRKNVGDINVLNLLGAYLTNDIIRRQLIKEREYDETHDKLTGLLSRKVFSRWEMHSEELGWDSLGIFMADIYHLHDINEEMGYFAGNKQLQDTAEAISSIFDGYYILRYDDDEFLVLCPNIQRNVFSNMCEWAKEKLREILAEVCVGYSWKTDVNVDGQVKEAQAVLRQAKEYYEQNIHSQEEMDQKVLDDMDKDIAAGNVRVYLQPKVSLKQSRTVGAEALVRLYKPDVGIIPPGKFIANLEEHNAIYRVDLYILEQVCKFQKEMLKVGEIVVPISLNFSKKTLIYPYLISEMKRIMDTYQVPSDLIEIEITEGIGELDNLVMTNIADAITNMGYRLVMDDFGTEYSNLHMLFKFPFEIAKIDRSLVTEITENEQSRKLMKHLLSMLPDMNLGCVVEGVETEEQINLLRDMDADVIQGYYFGKPEPIEVFYDNFMGDDAYN